MLLTLTESRFQVGLLLTQWLNVFASFVTYFVFYIVFVKSLTSGDTNFPSEHTQPTTPLMEVHTPGWQSPPHPDSQSILPCSLSATFATQHSLNKVLGRDINLPLHSHFWKCKMQLVWLTSGTHKTKWLLGNATLEEDVYGPKAWTMSVEKWEASWFLSMPTVLDSVCVIWSRKIPQACV